jgi:hypothetical protein
MTMRSLLTLVLLIFSSGAAAQVVPPKERLVESVAGLIPTFWSVGEMRVIATANLGDTVEPKIKQRFEADVMPSADLFVTDTAAQATFGPYMPLLPTLAAGAKRTLHGISTSTYAAGAWAVEIKLENDVAGLGQPADLFSVPTVVRGSEEEARLRERLRTDMVERLRARLAAEREQVETQLREALSAFQTRQAADLARVREEQAAALRQEEEELARMRSAFAVQLEATHREREALLASLEQKHATGRAALVEQQQIDLDRLKAAHEAEINRLQAEYAQAVAQTETEIKGRQELVEAEQRKQEEIARLAEAQKVTAERERAIADERRKAEMAAQAQEQAATEQEQRARQEALDKAAQGKAQQIERMLTVMQGKERAAALAALEAAIIGNDQAVRDAALSAGLTSEHPPVRHRALRLHFANAGTVSGMLAGRNNGKDFTGTFSLVIEKREERQGTLNFGGLLRSPLFGRDGCSPVQGTLDGDVISASGKICSLTMRLAKGQTLEGSLHHDKVSTPDTGCCPSLNLRATALVR